MATCTRIIINIILALFLVIIICIIAAVVYFWVTCPSLTRCAWRLIVGKGRGGSGESDKDYLASMGRKGIGRDTGVDGMSVFGTGAGADDMGRTAVLTTEETKLVTKTKDKDVHYNEGGDFNDGNNLKTLAAEGTDEGRVPATPSKTERAFDRMGSSYKDW